jgi:hypothetical protein
MEENIQQTQEQDAPAVAPVPVSTPKPKLLVVSLTAVLLILILTTVIYLNGKHNQVLTLPAHLDQTATPTQENKIVDTAPAIPLQQKTKLVIRHADSSFETFLVPSASVEIFKKSLLPGDSITQTSLLK